MQERTIGDTRTKLTVSEICLGTMYFGYRTDETTAFAILDRFADAGGTFLDTANNYGQWHGDAGESERVIGRWLRSRGMTSRMVIATKVGARTTVPGDPDPRHWQGLSATVIREDAETSLRNLGVDRLDLYYAHIDDRSAPLEETVSALATLAETGKAGLLGASNTATWRIERARAIARAAGRPNYSCVQQQYTYLQPLSERGQLNLITEELLDYAAAENLALFAYSPLLAGRYARSGRALPAPYTHSGSDARLTALRSIANKLGATPGQVVLAWLLARTQPAIIPIPGASTVAQLDEIIGATRLTLDQDTIRQLDQPGSFTPAVVGA
ncbi:MAG TPA: aldo/keto reductase [Streptosporangiaceae bacterium]|nr:aldo/keto reductase [Streptosporangiaceae bacterium]